jgi:hypothetical protein
LYTFTESNFLCVITSLAEEEENSAKGFRRGVVVVVTEKGVSGLNTFTLLHTTVHLCESPGGPQRRNRHSITTSASTHKKKNLQRFYLFPFFTIFFLLLMQFTGILFVLSPFQHAQLNCTCKYKKKKY